MVKMLLSLAAASALFVGSGFAQTSPPPPVRPGDPAKPGTTVAPAGDAPHAYRVKGVLGAKVSLKGDVNIGTVDDIVFSDAGQVEYLIVVNDGKLVTIPWEAAKFDFDKRVATVNITQDQYKVIPTYTTSEYPVYFEPTYRTQVYGWYGLKPRPWGGFRR